MTAPAVLSFAYILDLAIGDPRQLPHPVRGIGWAIEKTEEILRGRIGISVGARHAVPLQKNVKKEKIAGVALPIVIVGLTYALFYVINKFLLNPDLPDIGRYLALVILVYLASTTVSTRELVRSGESVMASVNSGDIEKARKELGMIVGRDTTSLDNKGIFRATVETLSENTSDGIVAPLFYFALGGLPLAMTYKAINTLDSMVGYKNEKYNNFGWVSAKLDDIANYIPARLTGCLIVVSTFVMSFFKSVNGLNSLKIMIRDGKKHASPNSGIPEAAMAGALGVQLGGPSLYGGAMIEKPFIGEEDQNLPTGQAGTETFYVNASESALTITKITSLVGLLSALAILYVRAALWN
jgi:adenosylcobinamide-phosphate synthase